MKIKCILLCGSHDSGKTSSLSLLFYNIDRQYIFIDGERPYYDGERYHDFSCLLKKNNEEKYLVIITVGDSVRYIDKCFKSVVSMLKERNLNIDSDNMLFVVATRSFGETIDFYSNRFGYERCLMLLKNKSNNLNYFDENNTTALQIEYIINNFLEDLNNE